MKPLKGRNDLITVQMTRCVGVNFTLNKERRVRPALAPWPANLIAIKGSDGARELPLLSTAQVSIKGHGRAAHQQMPLRQQLQCVLIQYQ